MSLLGVALKHVCSLVIEQVLKHGHKLGRKCLKQFGSYSCLGCYKSMCSWAPSYSDFLSWKNLGEKISRNWDKVPLMLWEPQNTPTTASSVTCLLGQQKLVPPLSLVETWREIFQFVVINLLLLCALCLRHQLCGRLCKNTGYKNEGTNTVIMDLNLPAATLLKNYLKSHKCGH